MKLSLFFLLASAVHKTSACYFLCGNTHVEYSPTYRLMKAKGDLNMVDIDCDSYHAGCEKKLNAATASATSDKDKCSPLGEYAECMQQAQCIDGANTETANKKYLEFFQTKNTEFSCQFPADAAYCDSLELATLFQMYPKSKAPCEKIMMAGDVSDDDKCNCYKEIEDDGVAAEVLTCKFDQADPIRPVAFNEWKSCSMRAQAAFLKLMEEGQTSGSSSIVASPFTTLVVAAVASYAFKY